MPTPLASQPAQPVPGSQDLILAVAQRFYQASEMVHAANRQIEEVLPKLQELLGAP